MRSINEYINESKLSKLADNSIKDYNQYLSDMYKKGLSIAKNAKDAISRLEQYFMDGGYCLIDYIEFDYISNRQPVVVVRFNHQDETEDDAENTFQEIKDVISHVKYVNLKDIDMYFDKDIMEYTIPIGE